MLPTQVRRSKKPSCLFSLFVLIAVATLFVPRIESNESTRKSIPYLLTASDSLVAITFTPGASITFPFSFEARKVSAVGSLTSPDQEKHEALELMSRADLLRADSLEASLCRAAMDYDEAALLYARTSDFVNAASASLQSGDIYFRLAEYGQAISRYENVQTNIAKTSNWTDGVRALCRIARVHSYLGNNDLAQKQIEEAQALFKKHDRID